jgi:hypothetical protein
MAEQRRENPRLTEDLYFHFENKVDRYGWVADGPIQYITIANLRGVIGFIWAADQDDAISWVARRGAGADGHNGAQEWLQKLPEMRARGLSPSQVLAEFLAWEGPGSIAGKAVPGSLRTLPNVAALKELALNV